MWTNRLAVSRLLVVLMESGEVTSLRAEPGTRVPSSSVDVETADEETSTDNSVLDMSKEVCSTSTVVIAVLKKSLGNPKAYVFNKERVEKKRK